MQKTFLDNLYFRSIIQLTGVEVTEETVLVVESLGYFGRIGALLDQIPKRVLANYLVLKHVLDLAGATTDKMRQLQGETDFQTHFSYDDDDDDCTHYYAEDEGVAKMWKFPR